MSPSPNARTRPLRIVVPACNEEGRIEPTLHDYCERFADTATIIVVANGCTDRTATVVRRLQSRYDNLELREFSARIGKGGAVRIGLSTGREPYVGFVDADGSTSAAEYARLLRVLADSDADAVIGSRWKDGAVVEPRQGPQRVLASRTFNAIVRTFFGLPFEDTQCGAKLFRRTAVDAIAHALEIADFAFDIEVLWRLRQSGARVLEVATVWSNRPDGTKIRLLRSSSAMLSSVVRLRLRDSLLWRIPFMDLFHRHAVIPVRSGPRILLLGFGTQAVSADVEQLLNTLGGRGFSFVRADDKLRGGRAFRRLRLLAWYAFGSHRDYDALLELAQRRAALLPALSAKPCFVVFDRDVRAVDRAYDRLYGRCVRLDLARSAGGAEEASAAIGGLSISRAFFTSREPELTLEQPVLR